MGLFHDIPWGDPTHGSGPFWTGGTPEAGRKLKEIVLDISKDSKSQVYLEIMRNQNLRVCVDNWMVYGYF